MKIAIKLLFLLCAISSAYGGQNEYSEGENKPFVGISFGTFFTGTCR